MTYLLDVNALLAFRYATHVHHERVRRWLEGRTETERDDLLLATCSITELGFVRVATGPARLTTQVIAACAELTRLKRDRRCIFLGDPIGAERLPSWVLKSKQTTDGHLLQLASAYGSTLATLDKGIPGALLIPELPDNTSRVSEPRLTYGAAARGLRPAAAPPRP